MNRWTSPYWLLTIGVLYFLLAGCTLNRNNNTAGDIAEFVPPSAGLSAELAQADETIIRLNPSSSQLNIGETAIVDILIDNVADLSAVDIELSFNADLLQVRDDDPNEDGAQILPGEFLSADFVVDNEADNATGDIFYAVTQLGTTPPANGSGRLASITFEGIAEGISQVTFTQVMLVRVTQDGSEEIPATPQSGQLTVGQPTGEPTETDTPTATYTPGTPTATATLTSTPDAGTPTATPTVTQTFTSTPTPTPPPSVTPTPLPPPTPTPVPLADVPELNLPPDATEGFCYRVQEGDTLYSLGQKFGVDPGFINFVNDLNPPGYIFLHQALFIPETHGSGPNVYRVKLGDTLAKIADACHLPADFLAQVNLIKEETPLYLKAGDTAIRKDGSFYVAPEDEIIIEKLIIPLPPFAPPSRYPYPGSVSPPIPPPCYYPRCY